MSFKKDVPYNNLPLLPPAFDVENKAILKKAIEANKALATLVSDCKRLPNEAVLYNSLFLKEAKDSSEIENIVTTNDELYQAQALSSKQEIVNPNTREVLHYLKALWVGIECMIKTGVLSERTFVKVVNTIKGNNEGLRKNTQTRIVNQKTGEIIYAPPEGLEIIQTKLKNLEEYINLKDDIDPLIKMAIIHYQFESIHPFSDGNGRTGRILNVLYLVNQGLIEHPMLFLSKKILETKDKYYLLLQEVTERQKWEEWIVYMLEGIIDTSKYTSEKITKILEAMEQTKKAIRENEPKIYSKDLLEVLFKQPYCKAKFLEEDGIARRVTATKYLRKLEGLGILSSVKVGREILFVNKKFYEILKS